MIFKIFGFGANPSKNHEEKESELEAVPKDVSSPEERASKAEDPKKAAVNWEEVSLEANATMIGSNVDPTATLQVINDQDAILKSTSAETEVSELPNVINAEEGKKSFDQKAQLDSDKLENLPGPMDALAAAPPSRLDHDPLSSADEISEQIETPGASKPEESRSGNDSPIQVIQDSADASIVQMSNMISSREDVIAAYKIFLGRLPESIQVITPWVGVPTEKLLIDFMVSNEFLSNPDRVRFVVNLAKKIIEAHAKNTSTSEDAVSPSE